MNDKKIALRFAKKNGFSIVASKKDDAGQVYFEEVGNSRIGKIGKNQFLEKFFHIVQIPILPFCINKIASCLWD